MIFEVRWILFPLYYAIVIKISLVEVWQTINPNNKHSEDSKSRPLFPIGKRSITGTLPIDFCADQTRSTEVFNGISIITLSCLHMSVKTDVIYSVLTHVSCMCSCTFDSLIKKNLSCCSVSCAGIWLRGNQDDVH